MLATTSDTDLFHPVIHRNSLTLFGRSLDARFDLMRAPGFGAVGVVILDRDDCGHSLGSPSCDGQVASLKGRNNVWDLALSPEGKSPHVEGLHGLEQ